MNIKYKESEELALQRKWKTVLCGAGEKCWCRGITMEEELRDKDGEIIYIIGTAEVNKIYAEHIVKLHNDSLK